MALTTIGTTMITVMKRESIDRVMWGDAFTLDRAYYESGSKAKNNHPLNRWQHVLNALDRDERFEKWFVKIDLGWNDCFHPRLVRCFKLREEADR